MKITFQLTNEDFLAYQLYTSNKSDLVRKSQLKSKVMPAVFYVLIGLFYLYAKESIMALIIWSIAGLLWYLLYPTYGTWKYRNYLIKYIQEHYKNRINKDVVVELSNGSINTTELHTYMLIDDKQFKELIDTKAHFFVKLNTDISIIVPKRAIHDVTAFKAFFTDLTIACIDEQTMKLN